MPVLARAALYFALVFGVGFALGIVRVLWLVPRVGDRAAELIETPFMLLAIVLSARFVVRRIPGSSPSGLLVFGAISLGLLLLVELSVVLGLRGLTLAEYVASRDPVSALVYAASLVVFAVMPWLVGRRATASDRSPTRPVDSG